MTSPIKVYDVMTSSLLWTFWNSYDLSSVEILEALLLKQKDRLHAAGGAGEAVADPLYLNQEI